MIHGVHVCYLQYWLVHEHEHMLGVYICLVFTSVVDHIKIVDNTNVK